MSTCVPRTIFIRNIPFTSRDLMIEKWDTSSPFRITSDCDGFTIDLGVFSVSVAKRIA